MSKARFGERHPGWAALWVVLFMSVPQWAEWIWSLYSSAPLVPWMARAIGLSGVPDVSLTVLLWVTIPIGLVLLALILYRSRSGTLLSKDVLEVSIQMSKPLYVERVDLVLGEGKSPYWMLVLSDAVVRNRTKSRMSLMFELHCKLKDGRPCEIPERSDLDAFIKTPESPHQFLRGPVALDSRAHAQGDLCFGYAEFPPTREGPGLDTSHTQLVVLDRLSGRKAVLDL
ncbi:MAG: hypothetical protein IH917_08885 [Acidobacteria bacterium]|nr:hypothetical protein [Acidobacteriota bacterium]